MWKPIPNYEGYEVTDEGQVRTWHPRNGRGSYKQTKSPRLLKPSRFTDSEYLRVSIKETSGKRKTRRVHQLVLEAFVGPRPKDHIIMHINDDATDNRLTNLKYGTFQDNSSDMVAKGRSSKGESHPKSLCSDNLRQKIIDMALVHTYRGSRLYIADSLDVPINTVRRVIESYNLAAIKEGKQVAKITPKDSGT